MNRRIGSPRRRGVVPVLALAACLATPAGPSPAAAADRGETSAALAAPSWQDAPKAFVVLGSERPADLRAFTRALEAAGGHVAIVYPPRAAVVFADEFTLARPEIASWLAATARGAVTAGALRAHGEAVARAAAAWSAALEIEALELEHGGEHALEALRPFDAPPDAGPRPRPLGAGGVERATVSDHMPYGAQYYDTSEFLAGSVAVGVWLIEAAGSTYDWSTIEESATLGGVQLGLTKWVHKAGPPSALSFTLDIHTAVPVSGVPIENSIGMDGVWVDEALAGAGWSGGDAFERCFAYNNAIRDQFDTHWCYSIFIVDSDESVNQGLFAGGGYAFAYFGGPYVWMSRYSTWAYNAGRYRAVVPMHETGHIFMATDEYDGLTQFSGYLNQPDTQSAAVQCIMNQNDSTTVCTPSRNQLGIRDVNVNGIIDILDRFPTAALTPLAPDPTLDTTPTWTGSGQVTTLNNLNPNSNYNPAHAMTIVTITEAEGRVDGGPWSPAVPLDGAFDGYVEAFEWTVPAPLVPGLHFVETRTRTSVGNYSQSTASSKDTIVVDFPVDVPVAFGPARLAIDGIHPNPTRGPLSLTLSLASSEPARLEVLDGSGRRVAERALDRLGQGRQRFDWSDAPHLSNGIYVVRLTQGDRAATAKAVVIR